MWTDVLSIVSVYILALIGLASVVILSVAIFLAYKYDISFSIRSGNDKKKRK